jgi:tRNA-specific 2-thiouridylase
MKKILVWMSGWVDSAIAAFLLKKKYDVTAWFMKNYISDDGKCTTYEDANEAIKVSKFLWIKILSFDLQKEYNQKIIKYIFDWYKKWITPNPDILCNTLIKFDVFLKKALKLWFDYIAMWHYARISEKKSWNKKIYKLLKWIDTNKDQSYFLSWLNQIQLSKSLFPIWWMKKSQVRKLAKKIWLPNAKRKDSQWLCFIWQIPIKNFLLKKLPKKIWNILNLKWEVIWKHEWAYFYTIWQRHWLNLPFKAYVIKIDVKKNIIIAWEKENEQLSWKEILASNRHRIWNKYKLPLKIKAKIRYRQEVQNAKLEKINNKIMKITFTKSQRAIAPWQTLVAYIKDECIWNWIIM